MPVNGANQPAFKLAITDAAALAGALEVSFIDDFLPVYGDAFTIVTHASRTGEFETVTLPQIIDSVPLRLFHGQFRETVAIIINGDTNADGTVNLDDLNNVRNNFGITQVGVVGDTNYDDAVNLDDLNNVRNFFGTSVPPQGAPVPEPAALWLAMAAAALSAGAHRRRRGARTR